MGTFKPGESRLYINGQLVEAQGGRQYPNINPATEAEVGVAADASVEDADRAIAAARQAFDDTDWSRDHAFRARCLRQLRDGLWELAPTLRHQIVAETGAPWAITEHGPQCDMPIGFIDGYIDIMERFQWERELPVSTSMGIPSRRWVWKEAGGVVAAITPWNVPLQINIAKLIPALAAGCTAVLKAAPDTPWSATVLGKVAAEYTDLPPGVFNVLTSADPVVVGEKLVTDPRVDIVSFTGSTQTGRQIMAAAANTVKRVFLELGGKSASIVLDDADLATAIGAATMVCFHAGQGCALTTRLLLPRSRYEEGVERLREHFEALRYGDPYGEGQMMGPVVNARQHERVLGYIDIARAEGARVVCGGGRPAHLERGYYVEPTLLADVTNDMRIAQEEVFGPVLVAIAYDDDDHAVQIANDSIYGLSGAIFSADVDRALAMARRIRTGTLNINGANFFSADAPFGGYKQSGIGREMGEEGFHEYLETKTVALPA